MKTIAVLLIFFTWLSLPSQLFGQGLTISIIGYHKHDIQANGYGVYIYFREDPNKCDPLKGYISLEEKISLFKKAVNSIGLDTSKIENQLYISDNDYYSSEKIKLFKIIQSSKLEMSKVLDICKEQNISVGKIFYVLPEFAIKDEDGLAVIALNDANHKAEIIASIMGKKIINILSIDDDTLPKETFWERDFESERIEASYGQVVHKQLFREKYEENDTTTDYKDYKLCVTYLLE